MHFNQEELMGVLTGSSYVEVKHQVHFKDNKGSSNTSNGGNYQSALDIFPPLLTYDAFYSGLELTIFNKSGCELKTYLRMHLN